MQDAAPEINQTTICQVCGNMMFSGGLSNKKIAVLSGGKKSWVMVGKSILKTSNLLLLGELTNHLDLKSCKSLLGAIKSFPGSVLIMTHREYFLKEIANKLIVFEGDYASFLKKVGWSDEK